MKRLLLMTALMLWAIPAHATDTAEGGPCTGKVGWYTEKVGDGLYKKGERMLEVKGCGVTGTYKADRQILKVCPLGSRCEIEFTSEGDGEISALISVKRVR